MSAPPSAGACPSGDRVAVEILRPCRACDYCLTGRYMSCPNRDGAYGMTPLSREPAPVGRLRASYLYLHPWAILHKVSKDLPPEIAVMFNPLGAGVRWAAFLGEVGLGETVLILGPGQRGLASVIAARARGAGTIIVTGLVARRGTSWRWRASSAPTTRSTSKRRTWSRG